MTAKIRPHILEIFIAGILVLFQVSESLAPKAIPFHGIGSLLEEELKTFDL